MRASCIQTFRRLQAMCFSSQPTEDGKIPLSKIVMKRLRRLAEKYNQPLESLEERYRQLLNAPHLTDQGRLSRVEEALKPSRFGYEFLF